MLVDSLLGMLLRTILDISTRPQPSGPTVRFQFQDVTVSIRTGTDVSANTLGLVIYIPRITKCLNFGTFQQVTLLHIYHKGSFGDCNFAKSVKVINFYNACCVVLP